MKLQQEVYQLTKVDLQQPITILGNDEISDIANGIESMRRFALEKIEKERKIYQLNQELITSLSHDLRTPLTSLIGYLEILKNTKNSEEERKNYQNIALEKSYYIKQLTDSLFEYSYIQSHANDVKMEAVNGNELIMQMVEETLLDLEILGVKICRTVEDINCNLMINVEMIHRVFENIFSNIKKYADLEQPVFVEYKKENEFLVVSFKNTKKRGGHSNEGTHIGVKSCRNIMKVHHGKLEVEDTAMDYVITLYLPIVVKKKI